MAINGGTLKLHIQTIGDNVKAKNVCRRVHRLLQKDKNVREQLENNGEVYGTKFSHNINITPM